jgi:hypothetical protein
VKRGKRCNNFRRYVSLRHLSLCWLWTKADGWTRCSKTPNDSTETHIWREHSTPEHAKRGSKGGHNNRIQAGNHCNRRTVSQQVPLSAISGFRRDADEICALLGYNAASSDKGLPFDVALDPRRAQTQVLVNWRRSLRKVSALLLQFKPKMECVDRFP